MIKIDYSNNKFYIENPDSYLLRLYNYSLIPLQVVQTKYRGTTEVKWLRVDTKNKAVVECFAFLEKPHWLMVCFSVISLLPSVILSFVLTISSFVFRISCSYADFPLEMQPSFYVGIIKKQCLTDYFNLKISQKQCEQEKRILDYLCHSRPKLVDRVFSKIKKPEDDNGKIIATEDILKAILQLACHEGDTLLSVRRVCRFFYHLTKTPAFLEKCPMNLPLGAYIFSHLRQEAREVLGVDIPKRLERFVCHIPLEDLSFIRESDLLELLDGKETPSQESLNTPNELHELLKKMKSYRVGWIIPEKSHVLPGKGSVKEAALFIKAVNGSYTFYVCVSVERRHRRHDELEEESVHIIRPSEFVEGDEKRRKPRELEVSNLFYMEENPPVDLKDRCLHFFLREKEVTFIGKEGGAMFLKMASPSPSR